MQSVVGEPEVNGKLMFIRKYAVRYHVMLDEWCSEKCFGDFCVLTVKSS